MKIAGLGEREHLGAEFLASSTTAPRLAFSNHLDATSSSAPVQDAAVPYVVKRGDSLWNICAKALESDGTYPSRETIANVVNQVARANSLTNADFLTIGQKLDLSAIPSKSVTTSMADSPHTVMGRTLPESAFLPLNRTDATHLPLPQKDKSVSLSNPRAAKFLPLERLDASVAPTIATTQTTSPSQPATVSASPEPLASLTPKALPQTDTGTETTSPAITRRPEQRLAELRDLALGHRDATAESPLAQPREAVGGVARPVDISSMLNMLLNPRSTVEAEVSVEKSATVDEGVASPWSKLVGVPARLTSEFGMRKDPFTGELSQHDGIDIAAPSGSAVYPYEAGRVTYAGWKAGYGKVVIVQHDDGLETVYGHNSKLLVAAGQKVSSNKPLAEVGSTGRSTGSHLHFEARRNGEAFNPIPLLAPSSVQVAEAF